MAGVTINGLTAMSASDLTANDVFPVWNSEAGTGVEPTQKITAANLAAGLNEQISNAILYTGTLQNFIEVYLPSLSLKINKMYSVEITVTGWDTVYGWCMAVIKNNTTRYVCELSNSNGYHMWINNTSGSYVEKIMNYS